MFESGAGYFENLPDYAVYTLIVLPSLAVGAVGGWIAARKIPNENQRRLQFTNLPVKQSLPGKPLGSKQSQQFEQIMIELRKIEESLGIKSDSVTRTRPPGEPTGIVLDRLKSISSAIPEAKKTDLHELPQGLESGEIETDTITSNTKYVAPRTIAEEFTEMYNTARENRDVRNGFWQKFQTFQMGNRNASDQRMGRTNEPDFRTSDSTGDFIAVEDSQRAMYLVAPNFTVSVDDTSIRFGGLGVAYKCEFMPGSSYHSFNIVEPATFSRDGDKWTLITRGKLQLLS
jgi:hypothetical protein